jgi:hypothetical protein
MKLTLRERRLAHAAANVVWWMETTGQDLDGLLSGDRSALDDLRKVLGPYVRHKIVLPLEERRHPEPEP